MFKSSAQNPTISTSAVSGDAGTYKVFVTDINGCTAIATTSVIVNDLPVPTATNTGPVCTGTPVTVKAIGGTNYSWKDNTGAFIGATADVTIPKAVASNAGIYTVTVTNVNGCVATATTEVKVNTNPNPVITPIATVCLGTPYKLSVSGTTGNTYAWSGSGFTSTEQNPTVIPTPATAGTYTYFVTVSGLGGCTGTATTSVIVKPNPILTVSTASICAGTMGKIKASGADSYAWSNIDGGFTTTSAELSVTKAGIYTVIGTTAGCTAIATTTVEVKGVPTVILTPIAICKGANGSLTASGAATYSWSSNTGETFTSTTATISVTKAGMYTVIGTSVGGCTASATTMVTINTNPNPVITPITAVCVGTSYTLNISGTLGNTYAWSGSGFTSTEQNPTVTPTPKTAGVYTYSVLVEGTGGCTGTATTSVTVKANPIFTVTTALICEGTTGTLTASGADSYSWSAAGFSSTGATVSITKAGVYTVIGTTNGCTATATTIVAVKSIPTLTLMPITLCSGISGKLKAEGSVVDTYSWSSSNTGFSATTQEIVVSQAGTYTVIGTKDGCTAQATTTVEVKPSISLTVSTASICAGTTGTLTVSGANTYSWSSSNTGFTATTAVVNITDAGTYTVIGTSGNCTASATTTVTVKATPTVSVASTSICAGTTGKLTASVIADSYSWTGPDNFTGTTQEVTVSKAGTYNLTISKDGCTAIATSTVEIKPLAAIKATSAEVCTGGSTTLTATGGATYSWTGVGMFTATGATPTVSVAGIYTVTGTTQGGCIGTATATLTVKDNPTATITGNTIICSSGKTTLTANGMGTFAWTGTGNFTATTATVDVSAGTYQVIVTNGQCSAVGTIKVVNDNLMISAGGATVCEGGSTGLKGGATATSDIKSYAWSGPNGFTSTELSPSVNKPTATGTYTLLVTSNAGCTATATAIITVTPAVINTSTVTFCKGGKAMLTATGGTGATYTWTGGAITSSIEVTTPGTYNVTITDVAGCISKGIFTVKETTNPTIVISGVPFLCNGVSTNLTANKGTVGEAYSWTGPNLFTSTTQTITVTKEGDYNVKIVTSEGCEATGKITVTKGFTPTAVCGPVCEGENLILNVSNGLTYSWAGPNGFTASSQNPQLLNVKKSDAGAYSVTITGDGCTATVVSTLIVYEKPTGITATTQNSTCNQDISNNDGTVKLVGTFTGLKYDIVEGATYTGINKYADAADIPATGIIKSGITNPTTNAGAKYTVRVFNINNCYTDYTVTIQQIICSCGEAKCIPYDVIRTKSSKK